MFTLLSILMLTCYAVHAVDLSGKMFTFPEESATAHAVLDATTENVLAATVCLRFFTDLQRSYALFPLATAGRDNEFLIFKEERSDLMSFWIGNKQATFSGMNVTLNTWHSMCGTWDGSSGLVQLWLDGEPSSRKFTSTNGISGQMKITLGQEQDSFGGGFDISQSFVGMMSDLHMWKKVLTPCEIQTFADGLTCSKGDLLAWNDLQYQITGRVVVEEKQKCNAE